jgi:hypothetical protein
MHVSITQQILKIVRDTQEPLLLEGALIALSVTRFLKLADASLTLKMLSANINNQFAFEIILGAQTQREENDDKTAAIIEVICREIIEKPEKYGLRLVTLATKHLVDYYPNNLPPLIDFEEQLCIHI